ncbi:Guanine nucleotide-binding protein-like 3-like protein [Strongyloides ratti]|uniref:Guanine nucleotide-binding protein-like 3 homolog n=1 Tax=Strongyloides ratti TaxID=34506 RepID=A0A090LCM7_STRRB|nr:Guanine nucleotide-binding protein-like 3-like protein [Strongyloides ratti]CEF67522.1 Guanine nucleotide-binding protein-like 3-like protein [Strongyloides ratti]
MAKYCLNKASKRVTCRQRYKIEKKVRDHNKKARREAKKSGLNKKARKPDVIPNNCPFKSEMLAMAEMKREEMKAEADKKRAQKKLEKSKKKKVNIPEAGVKRKLNTIGSIDSIAKKALASSEMYDMDVLKDCGEIINSCSATTDNSYKKYASEVKKTIEVSDVVLEILDARNPLGSRNINLEKNILASGKRLVLVLNKIDLIPKDNAAAWLKYLRKIAPTVAFKASTQEQVQNVGRTRSSNLSISTSKCIGADLIMKLLGNYCRNQGIKQSIRVGVIGYPNVGKSSVINSLKRKKSCQVGNLPGMTKHIQEVELDKNIRLIDSPGVVMDLGKNLDEVELILKNAVSVENVKDPELAVTGILRRCSPDVLMIHYKIPEFSTPVQFLDFIARRIGRIGKGGITDKTAAAKFVLHEWHDGKLPYHTIPPEIISNDNSEDLICDKKLLNTMSKEFSLDDIDEEQIKVVESMDDSTHVSCVLNTSNNNIEDEAMEVDNTASNFSVSVGVNKKKDKNIEKEEDAIKVPRSYKHDGNVQLNKAVSKIAKKTKKRAQKTERRMNKIADNMGSFGL